MSELPFFMKSGWYIVIAFISIILSYINMKIMLKKSKKAIERRMFSEGLFYKLNPVYGDKAIKLARSYAIVGVLGFYFFSFFFLILGIVFFEDIFL